MKFTTDKIQWTDSMKEFAEVALSKKLDRLIDDVSKCELKISKLNDDNIKVEVSIPKFRAQAIHSDFYAAVIEAASKLKSIISRNKRKLSDNSKYKQLSIFDSEACSEIDDAAVAADDIYLNLISKEKIFELSPMTLTEAVEMFECTDYPFFVYKDIDDGNNIAIIYKRFGNTLGLIRCY